MQNVDLRRIVDLFRAYLAGKEIDEVVLEMILCQLTQMFGQNIFNENYNVGEQFLVCKPLKTKIENAISHLEKYLIVFEEDLPKI